MFKSTGSYPQKAAPDGNPANTGSGHVIFSSCWCFQQQFFVNRCGSEIEKNHEEIFFLINTLIRCEKSSIYFEFNQLNYHIRRNYSLFGLFAIGEASSPDVLAYK
jgi:hypothetical protein